MNVRKILQKTLFHMSKASNRTAAFFFMVERALLQLRKKLEKEQSSGRQSVFITPKQDFSGEENGDPVVIIPPFVTDESSSTHIEPPASLTEKKESEATPPPAFDIDRFKTHATNVSDNHLKELLMDRLDELFEYDAEPEQLALHAVDLLDELKRMENNYREADAENLLSLRSLLKNLLDSTGCELLDSYDWNAAIQRAVKIEYTLPEYSAPSIKEKKASGLRVKGRLIRKQEVILLKSKQN